MANIVIKPASGTLEFNTGVVAGSAVDTTLSGASRLTFDNGELNLVSYATGNLNRFTIDGSTSRLFSAYDQMSGSLMSINTIAGFPVFEAFSDNTIVLGKYGSKDFVSTGNKIGIGTAAPANKLEVFGTGDVSVRITTTGSAAATDFAALRFFQGGVQKGSVIANSGVLRIGAGDGIGANSGVYVNSAGSVGIGISPAYPLQIRKSGGGGSLAISVNNVMSQYGRDSLYLAIADDTAYVAGHAWYVRNATATDNFAMGINNLGNVGIGTDRPTGKLEVLGAGDVSVRITTSGNNATTDFAALRFFQGGAQKGSVIANNSVLRFSAGTNLSGIFISDSGNVGINSIPTGANNVRFQVNGGVGSGIAALRFENCGISGAGSLGIGGKTFNGWLPIQIDSSTTRYIPLYA